MKTVLTTERRHYICRLLILVWGICAAVAHPNLPTDFELYDGTMYDNSEESHSVKPTESTDGRSAYINNQFVSDETQPEMVDDMPPLYELLQKQMEQLLASSGPSDVAIYETMNETATGDHDKINSPVPGQLLPAGMPIFSGYDDGDNDVDNNTHSDYTSMYGTQPTSSTTTVPQANTTNRSTGPTVPTRTGTTSTTTTTTTERPLSPYSFIFRKPPANRNQLNRNDQKRNITFRTVASSTQVFVTPLGDLIFKYSIGLANPTTGTSASSTTTTTTSSGSLTALTDTSLAAALTLLQQLNRQSDSPNDGAHKTTQKVTQKTTNKRRSKA